MKFFILTIFCNLLSLGYLQETKIPNDYNLVPPDARQNSVGDWPSQSAHTNHDNLYGQEQKNINPKPCLRRNNLESEKNNQQISPSLNTKLETLLKDTASLKPHALRSEDYHLKLTRHEEPILNPVIDSLEESHREVILPDRKAIHEDNSKATIPLGSTLNSDSTSTKKGVSAYSRSNKPPAPVSVFRFVPSNEYAPEIDNQYVSAPSNVIGTEQNGFRSSIIKDVKPLETSDFFPEVTSGLLSEQTHIIPPELAQKLPTKPKDEEKADAILPNKCSHDEEPNNLIGHSRRSMSSYNDDDNNVKDNLRNNNDLFIESHIGNENAMASVLNVEKNTGKLSKDQGLSRSEKPKAAHEKSAARAGRPQFNDARREMIEPTKGSGVVNMGQSALMLMQTERICYACSTANNPTCWAPDRRTTVKYCRKGNDACLTKTFGSGSTFTLIRDCGRSCDDSDSSAITPRYKSCSMCHSELCNGAYSINGQNIIFTLLLIALVKYLN